jgi:serine protease Do
MRTASLVVFGVGGLLSVMVWPSDAAPAVGADKGALSPGAAAKAASAPGAAKTFSHGTGSFVSKNGHVLTNFHVVNSCQQLTVLAGQSTGSARIAATDAANDIALLATSLKPKRLAVWNFAVQDGEPVTVFGFPGNTERAVSGTTLGLTGWNKYKLLYLEAGAEPGMSGSAILDRSNRVIGINPDYA